MANVFNFCAMLWVKNVKTLVGSTKLREKYSPDIQVEQQKTRLRQDLMPGHSMHTRLEYAKYQATYSTTVVTQRITLYKVDTYRK